ncbi:MAG: DUF2184 domain-containing protein, partial [Myxococcales bacterium]|nr:DUF2184 domain-containing protein [Myxococcales bacterium]
LIQDLLAIAMTGSRLNEQRALQARRGMEVKLEKIVARGAPRKGKAGFVNHPAVTLFGTAFAWTMATPAAVIKRDLGALVQSIVLDSHQVERPDTLLLPPAAYAIASEVSFAPNNPTSVLEVFLRQSPYIRQIDQWIQLEGAGVGGADRIVCYRRGADVAEIGIPLEYDEMPPEVRGLEFIVHAHMRVAGAIIRRPMAIRYADGTFDATP